MLGSYLEVNVLIKGGRRKGKTKQQSLSHENTTSCHLKMLFLFFSDTGVNLLGVIVCAYLFVVKKQCFSSASAFLYVSVSFIFIYSAELRSSPPDKRPNQHLFVLEALKR